MQKVSRVHNWSGYPSVEAQVFSFRTIPELRSFVIATPKFIARGSGLSYGDASLAPIILSTLHFNKILSFDQHRGIIRCESGITLDELLKVIIPAGWFLPVTPGTKFITLGGAVAADIHGKNHHREGSITRYVTELTMMTSDGEVLNCNRSYNPEIFQSACGGMGLNGVILDIELTLKKIETSFINQQNIIARNFTHLVELLEEYNEYTYSVAWIDCISGGEKMGRGVLMLGEHTRDHELPDKFQEQKFRTHNKSLLNANFYMPSFVLNQFTVRAFNYFFMLMHRLGKKEFVVHYDKFFYPLDFVGKWNRLYGKKGFLQYQFVVPFENGIQIMSEILKRISKSKLASFLSVLKLLGKNENPISFPIPGFTLALDFPVSDKLFQLLDELDKIVIDNGGRLYLAKDARMNRKTFETGYPEAGKFGSIVKGFNENPKFESMLSKRLAIVK